MHAIRKPGIMALVIIFYVFSNLSGDIKVTGEFVIPTAEGEKSYKSVIHITPVEITIRCKQKIFQPFNLFGAPKQSLLKLRMTEVKGIDVRINKNTIFIESKESFSIRYRNFFHPILTSSWILYSNYDNCWILIISIDKHSDTLALGKELKRIIGERCKIFD